MGALDEVTAIDLFAGSGALGLEALSRGATHVTFVDSDRRAVALVRRNLEALGFGDRARIVTGEALGHVRNAGPVDLALCDPPYAFEAWNELLGILDARVVVIESDRAIEPPAPWRVDRCKRYGGTFVTIVSRTPTVHPE